MANENNEKSWVQHDALEQLSFLAECQKRVIFRYCVLRLGTRETTTNERKKASPLWGKKIVKKGKKEKLRKVRPPTSIAGKHYKKTTKSKYSIFVPVPGTAINYTMFPIYYTFILINHAGTKPKQTCGIEKNVQKHPSQEQT